MDEQTKNRVATAEKLRLEASETREVHWKRWGPYLSERQWGTVREDYSANGDAWNYFPHDHARSARLSLGRGWHRRNLRPASAHLLRSGAVERERSDPKGASFRALESRREPRRRRKRVLLLSRCDAHQLLSEIFSTSIRKRRSPTNNFVAKMRKRNASSSLNTN